MLQNLIVDSDSEDDLPPGWEERATFDGKIYYANHTTQITQWIHPRTGKKKYVSHDLPYGWSKEIDKEGKIQFHNESTNLVTYTDPRLAFADERKTSVTEIRYKFDASSKALQVLHGLDLSNKTAIVTGSNSGIGFEVASSLAMHGCCVIFACRSIEKADEAISKLKNKQCNVNCIPMVVDLASLHSVNEFAQNFKQLNKKLDILILNAGIFGVPYILTEDDYESIFQVCYLGHFYLLKLLESTILTSHLPRIVIVSSESHRFSNLNRENFGESTLLPPTNKYWSLMAYNNAKLCLILLMFELHARWYSKGVNIYAVHPGNVVYSNICRYWWFYKLIFFICRPFTKSLQQAASTIVFCATSPSISSMSGYYFNNCHPCCPSETSGDTLLAKKLWTFSEELIARAFARKIKSKNF